MKFRKKPVVIEAVQLRWDNWDEMCQFANVGKLSNARQEGILNQDETMSLAIPTLEGIMVGKQGDWIIKDVKGEYYPCKPDIFEATYEKVEE